MQTTHEVLLSLVSREVAKGCSIAQSKKNIADELAGIAGVDAVAPPGAQRPILTMSERTKEIMTEKKLPFAAAQSEASREYRQAFLKRGR